MSKIIVIIERVFNGDHGYTKLINLIIIINGLDYVIIIISLHLKIKV